VHAWRVRLSVHSFEVDLLRQVLAADEVSRVKRFRFARDRNRFIVARAGLRRILSRYLNSKPAQLCFRYGPHGKPYLDAPSDGARLKFNLSHSADLALIVVARGREVGVDVERLCYDEIDMRVAEQFFSPEEIAALHDLPPLRRCDAFFTLWTVKEAYLKAMGGGLGIPLNRFNATAFVTRQVVSLSLHGESVGDKSWRIQRLRPGAGYVGAVAAEDPFQLNCWDWPGS